MLEVRYKKDTKRVMAWNADESTFGNLKPKEDEEVDILDIGIPTEISDFYILDNGEVKVNPSFIYQPTKSLESRIADLENDVANLKVGG